MTTITSYLPPFRTADTTDRTYFLRGALRLDAVVTGLNGVAYLAAAGPLHDLLGASPGTLRAIGAFLLAFAVALGVIASRATVSRAAVAVVIVANAVWVVDSLVVARREMFDLSTAGVVWTFAQAAVVAGFAALEYVGLRRATTAV